MPDSLLFTLAEDIMEALVTRLTAAGIEVPDRRYVHAGVVALDAGPGMTCKDQLVVTFNPGAFQGLPGRFDETALICEQPPSAIYEIWLTRCVPIFKEGGKPPSNDELTAAAQKTMKDAREVWRTVYLAHKDVADPLFDDSSCRLLRIASSRIQGPEGGVTSFVMQLEVGLI